MENGNPVLPQHESIIFGTNNPNISAEDFKDKVENNFRTVDNSVTETPEDIIYNIDNIAKMLGAFSCRRIGVDEYDRKQYQDAYSDDENDDYANIPEENRMCRSLIEGANYEVSYAHNCVSHVEKNRWRHICLNMYYLVSRGLIPNPTHPTYTATFGNHQSSYHDFPRFFKVRRSSGDIQDAKWEYNEAITIHKSKTLNDQVERLYIIAHYLSNKDLDIHDTDNYDFLYKNIPLDSVLEINPEITEINFRLFVWPVNKIAESPPEVGEVMAHYNALHHEWCEEHLIPAIKRLVNPLTINLIYENNPLYNKSITTTPIN